MATLRRTRAFRKRLAHGFGICQRRASCLVPVIEVPASSNLAYQRRVPESGDPELVSDQASVVVE